MTKIMKEPKIIREFDLKYSWGSWVAVIRKHFRRDEYVWSVSDKNGDETYDLYSDIDSELKSPEDAEKDMIKTVYDKIGHCPDSQLS